MTDDTYWMKKAIALTCDSVRDGQSPFASIIVKGGRAISSAHNLVAKSCDITAHGEILAIRRACRKLRAIKLTGCTLYTNCEPCPMCLSAIHWAGIKRVVFGASISDAASLGFSELSIGAKKMAKLGKSKLQVKGGVLGADCVRAMKKWLENPGRVVY